MWFRRQEKRPKVYCSKCSYFHPINNCHAPENKRSTWKAIEPWEGSNIINARNNCRWYKETEKENQDATETSN